MRFRGGTTPGRTGELIPKTIPKHDKLIGKYSALSLILRGILSGSMAVILPKIAPKPYTKNGRKRNMPRMSKKRKLELSFFLNDRGRVTYNELCRKCQHECRQSFRAVVIDCPRYLSKRAKKRRNIPNEF